MTSEYAMLILLRESLDTGPQERWVLDQDEILIGRDSSNAIYLPNRQVSRRHARVTRENNTYFIEDLGSKNGTYVNGAPIQETYTLEDGDVIQVSLAYRFSFVDSESTVPLTLDPDAGFVLRIDAERRDVLIHGQPLDPPLSPAQFDLLKCLYDADEATVSREDLIVAVWGRDAAGGVTDQALDALVRRLRRRLAELAPNDDLIVTVRGHGFRLERT